MPTSPVWDSDATSPFDFRRTPSPGLLTPAVGSSNASGSPSPGHTWGGTASGSNSLLQPLPPAARSPSPTADGLEPLLSERPGTRLSVISSSSSTMALKRSYASSVQSSHLTHSSSPIYGLGVNHWQGGMPAKRSSYLPHSPVNRDKIQIKTPQPLGIGLGGLATAVDQRTLAFTPDSGIGDGSSEIFGQGMIWPSPDPAEGSERPQRRARMPISTSHSSIGHDERMRYLQEGPARQASPAESGRSKRPTLEPAARITSSPRQSESRSRSPAHLPAAPSPKPSVSAGQRTPETLHPGHTPPPQKSRTNSSTGRHLLAAPPALPHIPASQDPPSSALPQYPSLSRETTPRADAEAHQPVVAMPSPMRPLARILSAGSHHSTAEAHAGGSSGQEEPASASSSAPRPERTISESPKSTASSSQRLPISAPVAQSGLAEASSSLVPQPRAQPQSQSQSQFGSQPLAQPQPPASTGPASPLSPPLAINLAWAPSSSKPTSHGTRDVSPPRAAEAAGAGAEAVEGEHEHETEHEQEREATTSSFSSRVTSGASMAGTGSGSGSASGSASASGRESGSGSGSTTTDTAGSSTENLGTLVEEPQGSGDKDGGAQAQKQQRENGGDGSEGSTLAADAGAKSGAEGQAQSQSKGEERDGKGAPTAIAAVQDAQYKSPVLQPFETTQGGLGWTY